MSVLLNCARESQAASARLQIVIDQKRREKKSKVKNRVTEGFLRHRVAVGKVDAQRIEKKYRSQRDGCKEVKQPAHPDDVRKEARAEQDQRVEQHLELGVLASVRDRQHRHA